MEDIKRRRVFKTVVFLESIYDHLPKHLIHRDVHFENFLFFEGDLSGYIDFDLIQRNIRILDICYFLTELLAEETDDAFTETEWIEYAKSVIAGYEKHANDAYNVLCFIQNCENDIKNAIR